MHVIDKEDPVVAATDAQNVDEVIESANKKPKRRVWMRPLDDTIKIIDFGGATYDNE